jgi:hypothetical protein
MRKAAANTASSRLGAFEHRTRPLLRKHAFARRLLISLTFSAAITALALGIGVWGYHTFERLPYLDALLNASMILTGMGPVNDMHSDSGKLFASFYALFSGIAYLTMCAVLLAPVIHRFLHRFHLDCPDVEQ